MKQERVEIAIRSEDGLVILKFDRDVGYIEIDPTNCLDICEAMATAAFESRDGVKPVGKALKSELIERHRMKLTQRIALILNGSRENLTLTNGRLAQQLVEVMLKEVF